MHYMHSVYLKSFHFSHHEIERTHTCIYSYLYLDEEEVRKQSQYNRVTNKQLQLLKEAFEDDPFINNRSKLLQLTQQTGLSGKRVYRWFAYRRLKIREGKVQPTSKCM